jgi:hypothetical protein
MRAGCTAACLLGVGSLLAGCSAALPDPEPPAAARDGRPGQQPGMPQPVLAGAAAVASLPWPEGASCRERLAALVTLPEAAWPRLSPESPAFAVVMVDREQEIGATTRQPAVLQDLPAPIAGSGTGEAVRCLVLVERSRTARAAPRRVVDHAIVRSTYRRGTQHTENPDHAALRRKLRELDADEGIGFMATGDPGLDLIGIVAGTILGGFGAVGRAREEQEIEAALAATPRSFEEPVWEPYTYEVTSVEAARRGWLRAALVDRDLDRGWTVAAERRETRVFAVASGRHAKDRDLLEGHGGLLALPADLAVWEQAGLQPRLSEVVAMLAEAAHAADGVPADAVTIVAGWPALPAPAPEGHAGREESGPAQEPSPPARPSLVEEVALPDGTRRYRLAGPGPLTGDP